MPFRKDELDVGHIYHVYNRGVNHVSIFAIPDNYIYLLRLVKRLVDEMPVTVLAYCLMPNHYHFVLRQDELHLPESSKLSGRSGTISNFMKRLFGSYTQAFNKQQNRSGPLFAGRFRAILVDRDEYAIHLCRYVHLNPVTAGIVTRPQQWPYSNYLEWIGWRSGTLVDRNFIRQYFTAQQSYVDFVESEPTPQMMEQLRPYLLE